MKKSFIVLLHIGFWLCYFILIMVILGMYFKDAEEIDTKLGFAFQIIWYFALLPSVITFYAFYFLLFPSLQQKKFVKSIIYGLLISFGAAVIGYTCLYLIHGEDCFGEEEETDEMGLVFFMTFVALIPGIIALVLKGFIAWFEEVKLKEQLQEKNHKMELALVKSQLDPHFLFNTINNIDVLILKNANEASNYLIKLSDIMRFMLFETKTDKILLSKEIEYINKYIELQKIRTANADYVNFSITGTPNGQKIAPMVFIPFIENAFKHTTNKKLKNAICIEVLVGADSIELICENKFDANRQLKQESNGLGNDLIQKRLQLIYPSQHTLTINNQNNLYRIHLTIVTS